MADNLGVAREHYDALNHRDFARFLAIAQEDCRVLDVPSGRELRGHDGFRAYAQNWVQSFPDLRIEPTVMVATGDRVMVEGWARGTNTGPLSGPEGEMPPTGRKLELAFVDVFELRDGRIVANRVYYDAATFARQLGLGS